MRLRYQFIFILILGAALALIALVRPDVFKPEPRTGRSEVIEYAVNDVNLFLDIRADLQATDSKVSDLIVWQRADGSVKKIKQYLFSIHPNSDQIATAEDVEIYRQKIDNFFLYRGFQPHLSYTFTSAYLPRPNYSLGYVKDGTLCRTFLYAGTKPMAALVCHKIDDEVVKLHADFQPVVKTSPEANFEYTIRYMSENFAYGMRGYVDLPGTINWYAARLEGQWQKIHEGTALPCSLATERKLQLPKNFTCQK